MLIQSGNGAIGLCPFHDDHHPSFGVNRASAGFEMAESHLTTVGFCRMTSNPHVAQRHDTVTGGTVPARSAGYAVPARSAGYAVLERSEGQEVHREARVTPPDADGDITPLRV